MHKIPILFSENDIVIDFDKWKNQEKKILYIIGQSGSGKSTLLKKLSLEYRVDSFGLDMFISAKNLEENKNYMPVIMYDWLKENLVFLKDYKKKFHHYPQYHFLADFLKYLYYNYDNQCIIEGIHIPAVYEIEPDALFLDDSAVICKGTSSFVSFYRRYKRDTKKGWFINNIDDFFKYLIMYYYVHKETNQMLEYYEKKGDLA